MITVKRGICGELKKRRIPIYDRGLAVREWLSTMDYADAIVYVIEHGRIGEVYNVGSGNRCRNRDLLLTIFSACQPHMAKDTRFSTLAEACFNATTVRGVARPGHDLCYAVNCEKLLEHGWKPRYAQDFGRRVMQVVDWYANNPEWWKPVWTGSKYDGYWDRKYRRIMELGGFSFYSAANQVRSLDEACL